MSPLFLFLIALVAAVPSKQSVDNYVSPPVVEVVPRDINQTVVRYLKHEHRASLNFVCKVDKIVVTPNSDRPASDVDDAITQVELEDHLGEPNTIEWVHILQTSFQSIDSRGQDRELGTLGGDLGEFLVVLAALESQLNQKLSKEEIMAKLTAYLKVMSRNKFYYALDTNALQVYKDDCGCPFLNLADPPESKKDVLLETLKSPKAHSDEFISKVLADPAAFNIRPELAVDLVSSYFEVMWNKSDHVHRSIRFMLLRGPVDSKAFVMVKSPGYCNAQLLAPLISPELCDKQMGIYHGDAAVLLRAEIAGVVLNGHVQDKNQVVNKANELAASYLTKVLETHKEPVFTVEFQGL